MATGRFQFNNTVFIVFCLFSVWVSRVAPTRTKEKIYVDLITQNSCFRLLNGTHQIGCSSEQEGNTGVVYYLQTDEDWEHVLTKGAASPYVAVLPSLNFTTANVRRLAFSGRVNGIAVISVNLTEDHAPMGFSADKSCPNDAYGYYHGTEQEGCSKVKWNPPGDGLLFDDLDIPIFSLTQKSDVDTVLTKCWEPFNKPIDGKARSHPLCAMQLVSAMTAAKDTETCIRRSSMITNLNPFVFCDPLGDKNIVATIKAVPSNETRPEKSVIVVATRMDSMSMFYNEYPSADASVTGIVTLLATAKALWNLKETIDNQTDSKDVMFTFFQGEAFDYIGSSRMLYEMSEGRFPMSFGETSDNLHLQKINVTHIAQFVELSQVGMRQEEDSLWLHVDPSLSNSTLVQDYLARLKAYGVDSSTKFQDSDRADPLPPASLQRFLMEMKNASLPSFVISDHRTSFTNKYYNSRLDLPSQIEANYSSDLNRTQQYDANTTQSERITALATALAHYLFWAATDRDPDPQEAASLQADIQEVNHMLYCFLHSPRCELFNATVSPDNAAVLKKNKQPFPFYVSISQHTNEVTSLVTRLMAYFTGQVVENATESSCSSVKRNDKRYSYVWMHGSMTELGGARIAVCYKSTVLQSVAKSPAFDIDGYDWKSGQYSTWTESRWDKFKVRVFLIPSKQFETGVLSLGVVLLVVSLAVVYFVNVKSDILFGNRRSSSEFLFNVDS